MRLPPDISYTKRALPGGSVAYVFRHCELGELGRILVQARGAGACQCTAEVCGDASDPMTERRQAIFVPLGTALLEEMEEVTGHEDLSDLPPPPPAGAPDSALIESKVFHCETCGERVALLIFADETQAPGYLEDYARLMFPQYSRLNLPTWIIGPYADVGPPPERPAEILQVWPTRGTVERLSPTEFNPRLETLMAGHCRRR